MTVKRAFADLAEGQVHYWHGGPSTGVVPLVFLPPGPGTARNQVPLLEVFSEKRRIYAPDLMGMGDSAAPPAHLGQPDMDYFAGAVLRFLDAVGVHSFDLMGSSLGGGVAVAIAASQPQRVRRLVLNRLMVYSDPVRLAEMKAHHAPQVLPDATGDYVKAVWQRLLDFYAYFPWFKRDDAHRRKATLPPPEALHVAFVEQLKMCATSHLTFGAYWDFPLKEKLAALTMPVMAREDVVHMIPGAKPWSPVMEGEPLIASRDQMLALVTAVLAFVDAPDHML